MRKSVIALNDQEPLYGLLIASIGLARNFTVVTNNIKEFKRVKGLKLQNWV